MTMTSYSAQQVMLNLLGSTMSTPTWPSSWYVAASTTVPTFAKGSSPYWNFTEPTDPAYARQSAAWQAAGTQPADYYAVEPTASVTFPTASQDWGTVLYLGVFDALTSGNLWFFFPAVRTTADGVLTAGSTALSSATMDFTSADVGQIIYAQGLPVGTTIVSVTSSTAVVLSAESAVSATGVSLALATPVTVGSSESYTFAVGNLLAQMG